MLHESPRETPGARAGTPLDGRTLVGAGRSGTQLAHPVRAEPAQKPRMTPQIYLLHFTQPYRHAQHYLGFTEDLDRRLQQHRSGRGSPLVAAAINAGTHFELAATWTGDRREERRLHRYKNSGARLCPICRAERQRRVSSVPAYSADKLVLEVLAERGEALTLSAITALLRRRGHLRVASLHSAPRAARHPGPCPQRLPARRDRMDRATAPDHRERPSRRPVTLV